MKRRDFLKLSAGASVAVAAAPLASLLPAKRYVLAWHGQTVFPVYGMSGGLSSKSVCYELEPPFVTPALRALIVPRWANKFDGGDWLKTAVPVEMSTLQLENYDLGLPKE